jgi:hypothetical protein
MSSILLFVLVEVDVAVLVPACDSSVLDGQMMFESRWLKTPKP